MDELRPEPSQMRVLEHLKRHGDSSIPELASAFGLSVETVRSQVKGLVARGLVRKAGARRQGPGRPEQIYGLDPSADAFFPNRQSELLEGLAPFLQAEGQQSVLVRYMEQFSRERRQKAMARLNGMEGRERLEEAARILTDEGYMAEVVPGDEDAPPRLRLCHCPLRDLVRVTSAPCKAEIGFVRALVGDTLARVEYLPDGDGACTYAVGRAGGSGAA